MTEHAKAYLLFTLAEVAIILGRKEYTIWYHTQKNVKPLKVGKRRLLTSDHVKKLIVGHLRLQKGETQADLLLAVDQAVEEKRKEMK